VVARNGITAGTLGKLHHPPASYPDFLFISKRSMNNIEGYTESKFTMLLVGEK